MGEVYCNVHGCINLIGGTGYEYLQSDQLVVDVVCTEDEVQARVSES